jgi:hypothetical protein
MESLDLESGHSNLAKDCCSSFCMQEGEVVGVEGSDDDQMKNYHDHSILQRLQM